MGLPNITIEFKTTAAAAIGRSQKGIVGLILREENTAAAGAYELEGAAQLPTTLSDANKAYVTRAFLGYQNPPRRLLLYVLGTEEELSAALAYFSTHRVDYLCGPESCTAEEAASIASFVKERRAAKATLRAVLPKQAADDPGIINVTTESIKLADSELTPAQYCSRVAGLIAGTPMTISCTYAPVPEVQDVKRLTLDAMSEAVDKGEFLLMHDGEKVKVARGVNSFVTTTKERGAAFRKIKVVEAVDMIEADIRKTVEDSYIGKYANSYDNKCLLISAIKGYLEALEQEGILQGGASELGIDTAAQRVYLKAAGVDTDKMTEQEIKEADTADQVFLAGKLRVLDAIEDVAVSVLM